MRILPSIVLLWACISAAATVLPERDSKINIADFQPKDIISRDVCIIGGGASGTYAAIRLQDLGKSVVLLERKPKLGGHTETYTDPANGAMTETGLVAWYDSDLVKNFFERLNVPLTTTSFVSSGVTTLPVDFRTGKVVANVFSGNASEGLTNYVTQYQKYTYLEDGFNLTYPVPADLLLPFGDYIKKYNLAGAVPTLYIFANGIGEFLKQTTLYALKLVNLATVLNLEAGSFQTTLRHDNSALYESAASVLSSNVLLSSNVIAVDRSGECVKLLIATSEGLKCIIAKKILLSIPPLVENLGFLDLDATEKALFGQFSSAGYYVAILNNTGIPDNIEVRNFGADTPYSVPVLPGPYFIQPSGIPGLFSVKYASQTPMPDEVVKADIVSAVLKLRSAGSLNTTTPGFVFYSTHTPFELTVPIDAIEGGFYRNLYALQGLKNTFWTGAAWHAQDSSKLWAFTEKLLGEIIAGL
ncbi:flavin-containing superfamily amine oxidase-like protein [Lepidopterella palustris CBS 459.81]|uniref:Flavin-containing superfamily amine oxidase-like protein n=1 Tax=Lepidopterella palustris CBS 459.81 TaxID=1314670 RepID=A0A8E2J9U0_9PEZI|nr:flavin-containing superfamily amine oxidase-like protein [Lepidopterella palustris CBS 459.81]